MGWEMARPRIQEVSILSTVLIEAYIMNRFSPFYQSPITLVLTFLYIHLFGELLRVFTFLKLSVFLLKLMLFIYKCWSIGSFFSE